MPPVTVLCACRDPVILTGLETLLAQQTDTVVAGMVQEQAEALAQVVATMPDVVLVTSDFLATAGAEFCREVKMRTPATAILVLTASDEDPRVLPAIAAGASGYLLRGEVEEKLGVALHTVASGQTWLTPATVQRWAQQMQQWAEVAAPAPQPVEARLTMRQREVLERVAQGYTYREIAEALHITERTVKDHSQAIRCRLDVPREIDLRRWLALHGVGRPAGSEQDQATSQPP